MSQDKEPPGSPPQPADEPPPYQPDPELITYLERGERSDEGETRQPEREK